MFAIVGYVSRWVRHLLRYMTIAKYSVRVVRLWEFTFLNMSELSICMWRQNWLYRDTWLCQISAPKTAPNASTEPRWSWNKTQPKTVRCSSALDLKDAQWTVKRVGHTLNNLVKCPSYVQIKIITMTTTHPKKFYSLSFVLPQSPTISICRPLADLNDCSLH